MDTNLVIFIILVKGKRWKNTRMKISIFSGCYVLPVQAGNMLNYLYL